MKIVRNQEQARGDEMREILFRGQSPFTKKWHEGLLAHNMDNDNGLYEGWYISNSFGRPYAYRVDPETVGQYTGLKDKNGVKVFEGDVVRYLNSIESGNGVVIFDACAFLFNWIDIDETDSLLRYFQCSKELEVIGNIHDNPELMGETK